MPLDIYIGKYGGIINKKENNLKEINEILKNLIITPKTGISFGAPLKICTYKETEKSFIIPRFYCSKITNASVYYLPEKWNNINVKFNGILRDYQVPIVKSIIAELNESNRCILSLATGLGKTLCALNIISQLKRKALIVVHKEFLMDQWRDAIKTFLPNATIGYIKGSTCDIGVDITLGMIQSLSSKNYPKEVFSGNGFVIFDEVHHCPAKVFSQSLYTVGTHTMLGLSATPTRKDGLSDVLKWHFGKIISPVSKTKLNATVNVNIIKLNTIVTEKFIPYIGTLNTQNLINQISDNVSRTEICITLIKKYAENTDNHILILSDRISHIKNVYNQLKDSGINAGLYIGGLKEQQRSVASECKVICGSYSMVSEAFNVPRLNTLFLLTPKVDITQTVGRILRKQHDNPPQIIDFFDDTSIFKRWGQQRIKMYKKFGFVILYNDKNNNDSFEDPEILPEFSECVL